MVRYSVAFIGTGPEPENPVSGESFAQAYSHAPGYEQLDDCELVACADLVRENAENFAETYDIGGDHVYEDYTEMLAEERPEIVSVCTPIPTHADIVVDCARSGVVDAIHCEKPMANTYGDSRLMAQECTRRDVQLTFNHQRRFSAPWQRAKQWLDDGEVGELQRVEVSAGDLLESGTHRFDLCNYFNGDVAADWVLGNVDYRTENIRYGAHSENQAVGLWEYENGVHGFASLGEGSDAIGCALRLRGSEGVVEVRPPTDCSVRMRAHGDDGWRSESPENDVGAVDAGIHDLVSCLGTETEPELSARRALIATEIIFSVYESARRRGRIDLPLEIQDNPLESMVETGALTPEPPEDQR